MKRDSLLTGKGPTRPGKQTLPRKSDHATHGKKLKTREIQRSGTVEAQRRKAAHGWDKKAHDSGQLGFLIVVMLRQRLGHKEEQPDAGAPLPVGEGTWVQPSLGWLVRELGTKTELYPADVQASDRHAGRQQSRHLEDRDNIAKVHRFETNLKDRARQKGETGGGRGPLPVEGPGKKERKALWLAGSHYLHPGGLHSG